MTAPIVPSPTPAYSAAGLADGFQRIVDVLQLLRNVDFSTLQRLLATLQQISAAPDLHGKVKAGLEALNLLASITPGTVDDQIAAVLQQCLTDEVLAALIRLVAGFTGGAMSAQDMSVQAHDREVVQAKGIPWGFLVRVALQLVDLLEANR